MKKELLNISLAIGLTAGSVYPEVPGVVYRAASHVPSPECYEPVATALGSTLLDAAMRDGAMAIKRDPPTKKDNDASTATADRSNLLSLTAYMDTTELTQEVEMTTTGIEFSLHSSDPNWSINAESTEQVLRMTLEHHTVTNTLRDETYRCMSSQIFNQNRLANSWVPINVIGNGDLCLSRQDVAIRAESAVRGKVCSASGRHTFTPLGDSIIYVAPSRQDERRNERASSILIHELWHFMINELGANPATHTLKEYSAYEFQAVATDIMIKLAAQDENWQWPLNYTEVPAQSYTTTD